MKRPTLPRFAAGIEIRQTREFLRIDLARDFGPEFAAHVGCSPVWSNGTDEFRCYQHMTSGPIVRPASTTAATVPATPGDFQMTTTSTYAAFYQGAMIATGLSAQDVAAWRERNPVDVKFVREDLMR